MNLLRTVPLVQFSFLVYFVDECYALCFTFWKTFAYVTNSHSIEYQ